MNVFTSRYVSTLPFQILNVEDYHQTYTHGVKISLFLNEASMFLLSISVLETSMLVFVNHNCNKCIFLIHAYSIYIFLSSMMD